VRLGGRCGSQPHPFGESEEISPNDCVLHLCPPPSPGGGQRGLCRAPSPGQCRFTVFCGRSGGAGWWRISKNLARYGLGVGHEHPATPQFWQLALRDAGFTDVRYEPVVAEAGIV
jgi:hypothetical protein